MKRIQDSVHGCIIVDNLFFKHIIDTPNYQRLRHIEQTSIRSIFPSARHDRFIHSLGVFHIGQMISNHLEKEWTNWGIAEARKSIIVQSYLNENITQLFEFEDVKYLALYGHLHTVDVTKSEINKIVNIDEYYTFGGNMSYELHESLKKLTFKRILENL